MNRYTYNNQDSKKIGNTQCPECAKNGKDRAQDNLVLYENGGKNCFSCGYNVRGDGTVTESHSVNKGEVLSAYKGESMFLTDRNIRAETLDKYGVKVEVNGGGVVTKHHYPYHNDKGKLVGIKTRVVEGKKFFGTGETSASNPLFGQHLFKKGRRFVTVTEGELDALAAFEMLGSRYPVVSVNNGANCIENIKANIAWLDSFETVVLCFDNDEAGRTAAEKVAPILGPNKVQVVTLSEYKDASEYLINKSSKAFVETWWDAKPYVVSGVATVADMYEALLSYRDTELIPLPESFGNLNEMTRGGLARGELTSIIAHTSIGKTTILNELIYHFAVNTDEKVGCFMVEDTLDETVRKVVSVHKGINLSLENPKDLDVDDIMADAKHIGLGSKVQLHDDGGGSIEIEEMFAKIRYFVKGMGCGVIIVDPLHTAIKNLSNENIEEVMDRFIKLCKETKACVILSTHTRKPDDGSHPHKISEYDVKGSGAIPQACHNNILFSRDKLSEDEYERNSTRIRVPKLRRTGQTGEAGWTHYNQSKGRLEKGVAPKHKELDAYADF
jgi:twinkle protein